MKKIFSFSVLCALAVAACSLSAEGVRFTAVFAPSEGPVCRLEKGARDALCLNGRWDFQPVAVPQGWKYGKAQAPELTPPKPDAWETTKIKIPSPWNVNDFCYRNLEGPDHRNYPSYPESWNKVQMGWLRRTFTVPTDWSGKRLVLRFEAVSGQAVVLVNGQKVAENFDLFLPFEADVSSCCKPGEPAEILVGVRSMRLFDDNSTVGRRLVPGGSMWGTAVIGIWQDVSLLALPPVAVSDVFVKPCVGKGVLALDVTLKNTSRAPARFDMATSVREWRNLAGTDTLSAPVPAWELGRECLVPETQTVELAPGAEKTVTVERAVAKDALKFWTPETPNLNLLFVNLVQDGRVLDTKTVRFGWREWTVRGNDYLLNGEVYPLRGDSWHFMGIPQMTRRYAWAWFKALKAANANAVRLHAQVYPSFYHDMADEMGICILDETANWASDGGPKLDSDIFWKNSLDHLGRFVKRDRNHPSVFGWSVSNENKPVIKFVFGRPDLLPLQKQAWADWRDLVQKLDPTRPWISSDGEEDGEGILPTTMGHYGDDNSMKNWKAIGKPWGVGETSMAYYGTPEQAAKFNGDRAYASMQGRMEAIANESYHLIRKQREAGASYSCVFNLAWYALKPLPFGQHDLTKAPTLEDGIFFGDYVEGAWGVQPERMGPSCSTFNPGYDPALPLWDAWPMFDAIRAANAPGASAWSPWGEVEKVAAKPADAAQRPAPFAQVVYLGDAGGKLKAALDAQGVVFAEKGAPAARALLIVDASKKLSDADLKVAQAFAAAGAELWIWGLKPETLPHFKALVGDGLELAPFVRSTFVPAQKPLMAGLGNGDFYFCDLQGADVSRFTLGGPWVERGQVILEACATNWRSWNRRAEEMKTAAILRSEREGQPASRAVIVRGSNGTAPVTLFTLDDFANSEKGFKTLGQILDNAGVARQPLIADPAEAFFLRDGKIKFPSVVRDRLKSIGKDKFALTFWVYSPRALDDLLIEPDMPKVTLFVKSRDGAKLAIGGVDCKIGRKDAREVEFREIPLKQGWNEVTVETNGPKHEFEAEFRAGHKAEFLGLLRASLKKAE